MGKTISSKLYSKDFFLTSCEGFEKYLKGNFSKRFFEAISLIKIKKGMQVLDLGAGRGELSIILAKKGVFVKSVDYSQDSIKIIKESIKKVDKKTKGKIKVIRANAQKLPFSNSSFDLVFLLDTVEHLYPEELKKTLLEVKRVLKPGGKLVLHTPNKLLIKVLYFFSKLFFPWWKKHGLHVNEQSYFSLKNNLKIFKGKKRIFYTPRKGYFKKAVSGFKKCPQRVVSFANFIDHVMENKIVSSLIYHTPLAIFLGEVLWSVVEIPLTKDKMH
ncbi:methyltransferase domain-containing protein [Patescibacteria group bacterium]